MGECLNTTKIKAINPQIIISGNTERAYYELIYYDITNNTWNVGHGSYDLDNIEEWMVDYLDIISLDKSDNKELTEAIEHLDTLNDPNLDCGCGECKIEREQLRNWLIELRFKRGNVVMRDLNKKIHDLNELKLLADKADRNFLIEKERLIEDFLKINNLDKLCQRNSDGIVGKIVVVSNAKYMSDSVKFHPLKKDGKVSKNSSGSFIVLSIEELFDSLLRDFKPVPVIE